MAAVIRFAYAVQTFKTDDYFWLYSEDMIWCMIEINTGLICACVPTLKPFFKEVVVKAFNGKPWSFGKLSENENALEGGGGHHRLQPQGKQGKTKTQITPNSIKLT